MKSIHILFIFVAITFVSVGQNNNTTDNLYDFAQIYGVSKFFHPAKKQDSIHWSHFLYTNINKIKKRKCKTSPKYLKKAFEPVLDNFFMKKNHEDFLLKSDTCFWQHFGLGLNDNNWYTSSKVPKDIPKFLRNGINAGWNLKLEEGDEISVEIEYTLTGKNAVGIDFYFLRNSVEASKSILFQESESLKKTEIIIDSIDRKSGLYFYLTLLDKSDFKLKSICLKKTTSSNKIDTIEHAVFSKMSDAEINSIKGKSHFAVEILKGKEFLEFKSLSRERLLQLFKSNLNRSSCSEIALTNGKKVFIPLMVDLNKSVETSIVEHNLSGIDISTECIGNLIEIYCVLRHFHPHIEEFKNKLDLRQDNHLAIFNSKLKQVPLPN